MSLPEFLFVTCQVGAEAALKRELAAVHPELHLAFSRPGFLTFKHVPQPGSGAGVTLRSVFARTWGLSIGKAKGETVAERAKQLFQQVAGLDYQALHVWQRDTLPVGEQGFEPRITPAAFEAAEAIAAAALSAKLPAGVTPRLPINTAAAHGQIVLDCVLVEPDEWWLGYHRAEGRASQYPGGLIPLAPCEAMVSRAYWKMQEALAWSGFPLEPGHICAEMGSAPGGGSQALLSHGLVVRGIDPAEMSPAVLAHPNFSHWKMRGSDLKRREYADVDWLTADVSLVPTAMLKMIEKIVTYPAVDIHGLLLALKLVDWTAAQYVPEYIERVKSWGYDEVRVWQLAHNRRELCLAAFKTPPRRARLKRKTAHQRRVQK